MKFTIENIQVAIKGATKYNNTCISEKLLAVVAGNYAKGNNILRCICNRCMKMRTSTL